MSRRTPHRRNAARVPLDAAAPPAAMGENKTSLAAGVKPLAGGGGIFKSAAVEVLRRERRLMTTGEITKFALEMELINCQGKTPDATMASALYTDIKRKLHNSVFTRPQEGMFGLREWEDEGFLPQIQEAEAPSYDPAQFRRTRQTPARAAPRPRRFKETTNSKWDDYYEAESPPSFLELQRISSARQGSYSDKALLLLSGACEVGSPMKGQRGTRRSSGRYETHYEEEFYYEDEEGQDDSESRQRWPARSADGKFRKAGMRPPPVMLPNRRRVRIPSPSLGDSQSPMPSPSFHDGLEALHEAATSPERQPRSALVNASPSYHTGAGHQSSGPSQPANALPLYQHDAGQQGASVGQSQGAPVHQDSAGLQSGQSPGRQGSFVLDNQQPSLEPAYKKKKVSHLRVTLPGGGSGAEVQRPVFQMHAYPPGVELPGSTDNSPWGMALGQTLATPRLPDPQTSPPNPAPPTWLHAVPVGGDAHASNSPSPAGEAALTSPTDLLLQAAEEEDAEEAEAAEILLMHQQGVGSSNKRARNGCKPWQASPTAGSRHRSPARVRFQEPTSDSKAVSGSIEQRPLRAGLRARAVDLPLQASRTSSHNLDMASPQNAFQGQPLNSVQPSGCISVGQLEMRVRQLEQQLGSRHPQVGKAWLLLSRAYQAEAAEGAPEHASSAHQALIRAWQICSGCVADDCDKGSLHSNVFQESFGYLFNRIKALSQPPNADLGKIPENMVPLELPKPLASLSETAASGS